MLSLPSPLLSLFAHFPLHSYPPTTPPSSPDITTLWIHPPLPNNNNLSSDVECLKWQAYIALRGLSHINLRWDVSSEGGVDARLPTLFLPKGQTLPLGTNEKEGAVKNITNGNELHAAHIIPTWVDLKLGADSAADPLEGYIDVAARDESRAWVTLLEGIVHAALILSSPQPSLLQLFLGSTRAHSALSSAPESRQKTLQTILTPPPPPLAGFTFPFPISFGMRISVDNVLSQYRDALASLSERLGTDKWFLGSSNPTPLDALAFAYLHCILNANDSLRIEVTRRVNLVAWEWRVRELVKGAFVHEK